MFFLREISTATLRYRVFPITFLIVLGILIDATELTIAADKGATIKEASPTSDKSKAIGQRGAVTNASHHTKIDIAARFIHEASTKLDRYTFGPADLATAERFAKQAKTNAERLPFSLLIARYQRVYHNRPDRGIAEMLPYLFPKEAVEAWKKETTKLRKETPKPAALKCDKMQVVSPVDETVDVTGTLTAPLASLPAAAKWVLTQENAPAAVETAACLASLGRIQEALAIIDRVGTDFGGENRVRAAETAGDLNVRVALYTRAVEFYEYGIKYLSQALGTEVMGKRTIEGGYAREFSEHEKALRARLERKRNDAQRKLDEDRYGPDWVLYRDATRAEWVQHNPAVAYLRYQKLINEYPETVYAEAARCYSIKCLLALSSSDANTILRNEVRKNARTSTHGKSGAMPIEQSPMGALIATIHECEQATALAEKLLLAATKAKATKPVLGKLKKYLEKRKRALEEIKNVPTGDKALKQAELDASTFLAANEYGLYRGETLLALADYWLEQKLNETKAELTYERAHKWFTVVPQNDASLSNFSVPGRAVIVAAPPTTERQTDNWGNVSYAELRPGAVFNRRTSNWYVSNMLKDIIAKRGFLKFVAKDYDSAEILWLSLYEQDNFYKKTEETFIFSAVKRLLWDIKNNNGCLYATPREMKEFNTFPGRLAVMYADLMIETDKHIEGARLYRKILSGQYGNLTHNQKGYLLYALSSCEMHQLRIKERHAILRKFAPGGEFADTPTAVRALSDLSGNLSASKRTAEEGVRYCNIIIKRYPGTEAAEVATFRKAIAYYHHLEREEGVAMLSEYLRQYPKGGYRAVVISYLAEYGSDR